MKTEEKGVKCVVMAVMAVVVVVNAVVNIYYFFVFFVRGLFPASSKNIKANWISTGVPG